MRLLGRLRARWLYLLIVGIVVLSVAILPTPLPGLTLGLERDVRLELSINLLGAVVVGLVLLRAEAERADSLEARARQAEREADLRRVAAVHGALGPLLHQLFAAVAALVDDLAVERHRPAEPERYHLLAFARADDLLALLDAPGGGGARYADELGKAVRAYVGTAAELSVADGRVDAVAAAARAVEQGIRVMVPALLGLGDEGNSARMLRLISDLPTRPPMEPSSYALLLCRTIDSARTYLAAARAARSLGESG